MHIDQERLKEVLARGLDHGEHGIDEEKACVMEAAAYVAGEPWSDTPQCVCPVIGEMMREWNDGISGVVERTALLGPLIPVIVGSASTPDVQVRRAAMMMDWAIRVSLPMRLRAAGHESAASELDALPPIAVDVPFAAEDYSRTLAHVGSKNERYGERCLAEQAAMSGANMMARKDDAIQAFWGVTGDTSRIALHCHCDGDDECKTTEAIDASAVDLVHRLVNIKTQEQEERDQAIRIIMVGMGKSSGLGSLERLRAVMDAYKLRRGEVAAILGLKPRPGGSHGSIDMWLAGKNAVPAGKVAQIEREAPAVVANRLNCQYCGRAAKLVRGVTLYPGHPETHDKYFWRCAPCGAHVGCHPRNKNTKGKPNDGKIPLGTLANKELRKARNRAHAAFDPLWCKGRMRRGEAYAWLRETLGISKEACHIGRFDVELCNRTVDAVAELRRGAK